MISIVVLGVGHSGTSIVVRMAEALKWNLGNVKEGVAENRNVQDIDKALLRRKGICHCGTELDRASFCWRCKGPVIMLKKPSEQAMAEALAELPQPWIIKDPRMVLTLDDWKPALSQYKPLLLHIERDIDRMCKTYDKHGYKDHRIYGHDIAELIEMARWQFASWTGPKVHFQYEDLARMFELWDKKRAK